MRSILEKRKRGCHISNMAFIVFEGLDGSGKSSLMQALAGELENLKKKFIRTREPGGTELGDEIRHLILRKNGQAPTARTELLLYEASRAQHVDCVIRPALADNQWVLCDRFTASSVAFQAGGRSIVLQDVEWLNRFATNNLEPDLTVLLDLSVEESKKRRSGRSQALGQQDDRIESEADSFHEKVRNGFLIQAQSDSEKWLVLDARKTPAELSNELIQYLKTKKFL